MRYRLFILSLAVCFGLSQISCGANTNIFANTGNKTTDGALWIDALKANNAKDYSTAISKILAMSSDARADSQVKRTLAAAYAGKCGLDFASFLTALSSASGDPFLFLMRAWNGVRVDAPSCTEAQRVMETITPSFAGRSTDDSFFMVILGLVKIGVYLKQYTDTNDDGTPDNPPFNGASNLATASFCAQSNMSNARIAEIGTGLGLVLANLGNVGGAIGGSALNLDSIRTTCNLFGASNPCLIESASEFLTGPSAAQLRLVFRSLLNSQNFYLPTAVNSAATACLGEGA